MDVLQNSSQGTFAQSNAKQFLTSIQVRSDRTSHTLMNFVSLSLYFQPLLPASCVRFLPGVMLPSDVIEAVRLGVDLFDTS